MNFFLVGILGFFSANFCSQAIANESRPLGATMTLSQPQLQRGAKLFINYCSGCHSLKYLTYTRLGYDLGLITEAGDLDISLLKDNIMFTDSNVDAPILNNLSPKDAIHWFGAVPPDLSLIERQQGRRWLTSYLNGFYHDSDRPLGVNNPIAHNTLMPSILADYSVAERAQMLDDIVIFLAYVGEPAKLVRYKIGLGVMLFLILGLLLAIKWRNFFWKKIIK